MPTGATDDAMLSAWSIIWYDRWWLPGKAAWDDLHWVIILQLLRKNYIYNFKVPAIQGFRFRHRLRRFPGRIAGVG